MSGHLVVLDRSGREGKKFPLESGIATIGRSLSCDIRVLCPNVRSHHATIVIHNNQAILRSAGGATQVNGRGVSVWRLRHGDELDVGGRTLRWHASEPQAVSRVSTPHPPLAQKRSRGNKNNRRVTAGGNSPNRIKLEIEALHRASMPASAGKQVAIVQPQRRDTSDQNGSQPEARLSPRAHEERRRKSLQTATKASLWIESRKLSPRKSTPRQTTPLSTKVRKPAASAKKSTPLRLTALLRNALSEHKPVVTKIQDPTRIDHTKQAALMLMTGHTPKIKPTPKSAKKSPSYVIKKPSPVRKTPTTHGRKSTRGSTNGRVSATPKSSYASAQVTRSSRRGTANQSVLEISDSDAQSSIRESVTSHYTTDSPKSPQLQSPRKSALKDPSVKSNKKNESIKFDLSNLENYNESEDILLVSNSTTKQISDDSLSESNMTLRFSDASTAKSPSPRRPLSSRSSKIIENSLGSPLNYSKERTIERSTLTPGTPSSRKSARGSLIVQKALESSTLNSTRGSRTSTLIDESGDNSSALRTKTLSPRKSILHNSTRGSRTRTLIDESRDNSSAFRTNTLSPRKSILHNSTRGSRTQTLIDESGDNSSALRTKTLSPRKSILHNSTRESRTQTLIDESGDNSSAFRTNTLSPRKSILHNSTRGSRTQTLIDESGDNSSAFRTNTLSPRKSILHNSTRGSRTRTLIDESRDNSSAFRTKTLSPRKSNQSQNMESYSIVDLVSMDSNETGRASSVYNSADSINSSVVKFGTPRNSSGRKSKSTIRGSLLSSSTPYVPKVNGSKRSTSSPNISTVKSTNLTNNSSVATRRSKSLTTPENTNQSINDTRIPRTSRCRSRINDSDLLLLSTYAEDTEDSSPKSSRRISKSDKSNTTIQSKRKTRSINATVTLDDSTINDGLSTPENRHSPVEEVRTPKLNIKRLLDTSQSSNKSANSQKKAKTNSKRRTIATVSRIPIKRGRHSAASRSLVVPAKKSLRLSPNASPLPDDEIVTPKSSVKIIQEAVKNKHSTAKKPQSKRSIIDNLNESDIVKQLFNSPVKRKLSQSMTEFSRKQLFDDEIPKKATRHTIALGRTPEHSILNNSEEFSPDAFVSPLSTPGTSPRIEKRLSQRKALENSGVKTIRSSRARTSVKNDLTNISGVKNVFAKSPRNRLSDIRGVKKIFAPSPDNDLRRVSGVKTLFKKQHSPKNDLTDVRGVKSLFKRASPRNDYRNVSGIKTTFAKPPKNDLSDVRGVKNMFGRKKRQTDYNNVSGVEDLFNESYNSYKETSSDQLFDQLLGKPNIKEVYSKSYAKKSTGVSKKRSAKSLHASIGGISNNVEDWLEQELQKRLHKVDKPSTSQRKSRELAILATDTVAGSEPVITSRVRNSALTKSISNVSDRKRSASELYSAHTLPIKKRSIIEVSLHKSQNNSQNKTVNNSAARHQLPIKKRVVVHSTPVKGRYNMTMNASELGRVSPIIGDKTKDVNETSITTLPEPKTSPQPKGLRATRVQQTVDDIPEAIDEPSVNITPKKSRGRQSRASQSRNTKKAETVVANVKKRRSSIVITKKSPKANPKNKKSLELVSPKNIKKAETVVANVKKRRTSIVITKKSPKANPKNKKSLELVSPKLQPVSPKLQPVSPKKTRGRKQKSEVQETVKTPKRNTRAKVQETVKTPKRTTRAKVQKVSVVVTKPSPILKPRGKTSEVDSEVNKTYSKRSRKNVSKELPETKGKQKKAVSPQPAEVPNRRTRKAVEVKVQSPPARRSKAAGKTQKSEPVETKRGRKPAISEPKPPKGSKTAPVVVVENRRGRRNQEPVEPEPLPKRGTKAAEIIEAPKPRRGKINTEVEAAANKRGRKTESVAVLEPTTKRGRKTEPKPDTNKKVTKKSASPVKEIKTKGKKVESQSSTQSEPTTRGRRNNQPDSVVVETKRSRRANLDDAKPTKKLQKSKSEEVVKKTRGSKTTNVEQAKIVVKQDKGKKKSEILEENPVKGRPTRGRKVGFRAAEVAPATKRSTRATNQTEVVPKTGGRQRRR